MATKRKPPTDDTNVSSKRQHTATEESDDSFRLLDLPPEIRNTIYTFVMADEPQAYLTPRNRGKPFCKSGLARTNRQIQSEVTPLLHFAFTDVVAQVNNFDFGHVITYFNSLDRIDLKSLPTTTNEAQGGHSMTIELTFSKRRRSNFRETANLRRWLNRMEHPTKQGADVDVQYKIDLSCFTGTFRTAKLHVETMLLPFKMKSGRQAAVVHKIRFAGVFDPREPDGEPNV